MGQHGTKLDPNNLQSIAKPLKNLCFSIVFECFAYLAYLPQRNEKEATYTQLGANMSQHRANMSQHRANMSQHGANMGQHRGNIAQLRANMGQQGPIWRQLGPT